jgi:hypothetical protein
VNQTRYAEILTEFEALVRLGKEVSDRLVGSIQSTPHLSYADSIFTKLLCHAISLHKLSPQIEQQPEQELWDLASACALARCVIEAFDVLGYIVFSEILPKEREFRLLVWRLHDQQRRAKMLRTLESKDPQAGEIYNRASTLQAEAIGHSSYKNIPKHLKNKIASGDAPSFLLSQRELNTANSVNHDYHTSATMWLSQYVHTLPMSVHQLIEFKAGTPEALRMHSMPIQFTLGFIAKAISGMTSVFLNGKLATPVADSKLILQWCSIVENGVTMPA